MQGGLVSTAYRWDARLVISIAAVAASGAVFTLGAAVLWGVGTAISVAVGASIAAANLYVLARIVSAVLPQAAQAEPDPSGRASRGAATGLAWGLFALVKMIVLFGGIWLLMVKGLVSPIPLVVGYGALPIGIAIGSLIRDKTATTE